MGDINSNGRLPMVARIYLVVVILGGLVVACIYATDPSYRWPRDLGAIESVFLVLLFAAGAFLADMYPVSMPTTRVFDFDTGGDEMVLSNSVYVASLLLFGPAFTIVVAAASALASDLWRQRSLGRAAFNVGQCVLTVGASGAFLLPTGSSPHSFAAFADSLQGFMAVLGTISTYFLLNSTLVAGMVALSQRLSFTEVWKQSNRQILLQYAGMLNVGIMAAILWTVNPLSLVLLVLPMLVVHVASKTSAQLKSETAQALVAIANMVDARDSYTYRHSMEVAHYSTQIATKLGLPLEQVQMIRLAAQLHDIGKIGTPDQVLNKPGPLNPRERSVMEEHPAAGARVLKYFSLFRPGADLALYHHEHYGGSGYPERLAGEKIPLGARIIHVADAYQAMTSNRVYRKALDPNVAVARLLEAAGKQFDAAVVKALIAVLRESNVRLDSRMIENLVTSLSVPRSR